MKQYNRRRRALWLFAGTSAAAAGAAALILLSARIEGRERTLLQETAQAETVNEQHRAEGQKNQAAADACSPDGTEGEKPEIVNESSQDVELPAGIPGQQVKAREESYCLVSENGFLLVFAKGRSGICLDTHMPLSEFPLSEQERLLDGVWFSSMMEVLHYLESYTS